MKVDRRKGGSAERDIPRTLVGKSDGFVRPEIHTTHERADLIDMNGYRIGFWVNKNGYIALSGEQMDEDGHGIEGTNFSISLSLEQAKKLAEALPEMVNDARETAERKFGSNWSMELQDHKTAEELIGRSPWDERFMDPRWEERQRERAERMKDKEGK